MEITIIVIGVSIIALFLIGITIKKMALTIFIIAQNIKYSIKAKRRTRREQAAWVMRLNHEDAARKKNDEKREYFREKDYSNVIGSKCNFWLERDKSGKIKSLYDINENRVPLANLSKVWGSKIIGNNPSMYYFDEKITDLQMLKDEAEIRKLNKNTGL